MTGQRKLTLTERADIARRMAREHRAIAADTLRIADDLDREARDFDAGIDPWAEGGWARVQSDRRLAELMAEAEAEGETPET
jgi:hypothetical protein